ncbi:MAG: CsbD family protein [Terracidiphilus sp.]
MNKDKVKGAVDQAVGGAKRRVGVWTGNVNTQAEGVVQEIIGKVETSRGKLKDAVREALDSTTAPHEAEPNRHAINTAENRNLL